MQERKVILTWEAIYDVIYKKPFPPSIIFYVVKEPENEVHILRVLRQERDWETILVQNQEYTYPE